MHTVIPYFILYCDFLLNDPQIASPLAMFLHTPSAECSFSLIFQHEELLQSSRCPIHYICSVLSFLPLCSLFSADGVWWEGDASRDQLCHQEHPRYQVGFCLPGENMILPKLVFVPTIPCTGPHQLAKSSSCQFFKLKHPVPQRFWACALLLLTAFWLWPQIFILVWWEITSIELGF